MGSSRPGLPSSRIPLLGTCAPNDSVYSLQLYKYEKGTLQQQSASFVYANCVELCSAQVPFFKKHLDDQFVYMENRSGRMEKIPLVTLSIAVVTNQQKHYTSTEELIEESMRLKKLCKLTNESCFYVEPFHSAYEVT